MDEKVNYKNTQGLQRKWFPYAYSEKKEDFIIQNGVHARCPSMPCEPDCNEQNPDYWKNFSIEDQIDGDIEIGCFGCSFTYGSFLQQNESWPGLLQKELGSHVGNFGVPGGGVDTCFINLKNAYTKFNISTAIVLVPHLNRRLNFFQVRHLYFQYPIGPHTEWNYADNISSVFFKKSYITKQIKDTKKEIVNDLENSYSLGYLKKITEFCKDKEINLFLSSYDLGLYRNFQKSNYCNVLSFYDINFVQERACDNIHPTEIHNKIWIDKIKKEIF